MLQVPREADGAQPTAADFETAVREFVHWIDRALTFENARYGIGIIDRSCLEFLLARPRGCHYREIAEYLRLSAGETTALVSRLERRGYARRERDTRDPDTIIVHAEADNQTVQAMQIARRALLEDIMTHFEPEELEVVARYARHVAGVHPGRLAERAEQAARESGE